jgi:hypothetical protein
MKRILALLFILGVTQSSLIAQFKSDIPIKIAISNEATAIPFTKIFTGPIHPTLQLGTEFLYKSKPNYDWYQTANIGYIFHNYLYQGVYLNSEIGFDYQFDFGIKLKSNLGLGYLHTFATQEEYQFKNGEYVNGLDWGNSRLMVTMALGFGYKFKPEMDNSSEIFLLYKPWIEYPYSPGFIPLMSHINFEIGYKFYLSRSDEK